MNPQQLLQILFFFSRHLVKPLDSFPQSERKRICGVFADVDNTLTTDGRLTAVSYMAMERVYESGLLMVPITGRPAGWCDHIARMWPVSAVVGENGAFYFCYDRERKKLHKQFVQSVALRKAQRKKLKQLGEKILTEIPGTALASDQHYRESDLAIDFCEDVNRLSDEDIDKIVDTMEAAGLTAKISSIHVNGWYGTYDKLSMTIELMRERFAVDLEAKRSLYVFVGDSPNDAPMFEFFPNAVGVANVQDLIGRLLHHPTYVTKQRCGAGFAELVDLLLGSQ